MASTLYKGEFVIDDGNYHQHIDPRVNGEKVSRGCIPRDFKKYPAGYCGTPTAVNIPLVPRSEWSARIKAMEETKSRISDIILAQNIPSLDQNGKGYCHTADTEVLTERGWVDWPNYDWTSPIATVNPLTHGMEFQRPFERHVYEYDGPMVHSTNRRIDFGVTPDHQMYVRKWDESRRTLSDQYSFVRAGDIGWYAGLLHAPSGQIGTELVEVEIPGDRRYDGDDLIALLGLVTSDGYAGGSESTKNWVSFASFREELRASIQALAARVGFHESPGKRGIWIRYDAGALANWLRENCYTEGTGAKAKKVPLLVKCASVRQIKTFLAWFDDRNRSGLQFYSASKQMIDDLQELNLRIGKRSAIGQRPAKEINFNGKIIHSDIAYVLTVGEVDTLCLDKKKHIETDRYKGLVYCAGVPNHTLLTRRNGSVLISSNCWSHSTVGTMIAMRATMNLPYVPLSAYSVACKVKNFRDEGGWGALSMDFAMKNGVPSEAKWPAQSMSKSNDNAETWKEAAKYKVLDGWIDLASAVYDRNLTFDQVMTLLFARIPVVGDYNWWGHSIYLCDPVEVSSNAYGIRFRNSWSDSYGSKGFSVLQGNKAIPDGAVAPSIVSAAA